MNRMLWIGLIAVLSLTIMVDESEARCRRRNRCCQASYCQSGCNQGGCNQGMAQQFDPNGAPSNAQAGQSYYRGPQEPQQAISPPPAPNRDMNAGPSPSRANSSGGGAPTNPGNRGT